MDSKYWRSGLPLLLIGLTNVAFAQTLTITNTASAQQMLCNIMIVMFDVLLAVSVLMVLWAAFEYITADGDAEKVSTARRVLLYAACGIVVAFLARGFPQLVASLFGTSSYTCGAAPAAP